MHNKERVRIGRDVDSDIRVSDIAVSRCHATIVFADNKFYISDNSSKFGTLVLLKNPVLIDQKSQGFILQVGKTTLSVLLLK
mmetsp:Transcript_68874/g.148577  ORF Transcript_68874/g.148577 Transcript_68874/m.148577 type:complete len:82 (-) Transcript_68874:15-260(-)